jgi:cyclophilin family peptidyl-prolyl cis-trans isomerase
MRYQIVFAIALFLCFAVPLRAADTTPAPVKHGPQFEKFCKIHQEMNAVLAKLLELRLKYRTANEDQRPDIQARWNEVIAEGKAIEPQLIEAAENAYAEAPNADGQITLFLAMLLDEMVQADDYEPAARIGKLLMDNNCPEKRVPNLAGIAAFAVSDFDAAEKYLMTAAKQGYYQSAKRGDKLAQAGVLCLARAGACKKTWAAEKTIRNREAKEDNLPLVRLKTTKGVIEVELFEDQAPNTVANFISLVQRGFYSDTTFYRVTQGVAAQTGDPMGDGFGGPGYSIACECYQPNHRSHFRGSLSMLHAGRDTGGSQFLIALTPLEHLNDSNTVFGRVITGIDVLAKLQRRNPTDKEAPRADRIIEAEVIRKRPHEYKPQPMPE